MIARRFGALALAAALAGSCGRPPAPRPNVLLVTLDTTRADHLSCYGATAPATPHFDSLAATGARFAFCNASSAVTPVSHATILTGRTNRGHRLRVLAADGGYRLPADVPSLATVLRARGWRTLAVHSAFPVSAHFGLDQGFEVFESFGGAVEVDEHGAKWDGAAQRRADETTTLALEVLAATDEPWFLWLHYWDPHDPDIVPPDSELPADIPRHEGRPRRSDELYAAEVAYLDRQFGRVLRWLEENGASSSTIVAIVADHGEGLSDGTRIHGWPFHRELYREQIHVPFLVRGPGVPAGVVVEGLSGTIDVAPTLLELCAVPAPLGTEGESLVAAMRSGSLPARTLFADQINGYDWNAKMLAQRPIADFVHAAIDGEWKLIYRPLHPQTSELFHLADDPLETTNLWHERPAEVRRLLEALAAHDGWVSAPPSGGEAPSAESLARLEQLGYARGSSDDLSSGDLWGWTCPGETTVHERRGTCPDSGLPMIPVRRSE